MTTTTTTKGYDMTSNDCALLKRNETICMGDETFRIGSVDDVGDGTLLLWLYQTIPLTNALSLFVYCPRDQRS